MKDNYLSKGTCTMVRGGAALIIVMHHLSGYVSFGRVLDFALRNIGALMATVFFFYSGYGLMYNLRHKDGYMESFMRRRLPSVLFPYLIANIFYILYQLISGSFEGAAYYAEQLSRGYTLVPYSWYVIAIIVLYCIFFVSFRWTDIRKGTMLCVLLNIGYMLLAYGIGFGEWWYNTCFAFSFGIAFAACYDRVNSFLQNKPIFKFIGSVLLFLVLLVLGKLISQVFILMLVKSLRAVIFCVCILYLSMLLPEKFTVLDFIGRLSFEIYLYQGFAISICWELFRDSTPLLVCMVLVITLTTAFIMHKLNKKVVL